MIILRLNIKELRIKSDENALSLGYLRNGTKLLLRMPTCRSPSTDADKRFSYKHFLQRRLRKGL